MMHDITFRNDTNEIPLDIVTWEGYIYIVEYLSYQNVIFEKGETKNKM